MDNFSRVEIGRMNYFRTTSKSTDSEKFDPFTSGSGAFVLEQEQKRGRQSIDNQNHPNVSSRGRRENLDYPAAMRPISASATSASTRTAGNSSGSSVSENPSVGMLRRRMMGLYKNITGNGKCKCWQHFYTITYVSTNNYPLIRGLARCTDLT